jgi:predicted tellurium resistance membrane protein TerC
VQIGVVDIVFSLDSVITAVGMVDKIGVMVAAVVASVGVMLFAAKPIGEFVDRHPSIKVLALAFLTMVGTLLIAEAFGVHVPKAYVYVAMLFSLVVEALNIRARSKRMAAQSAG